MNRRRWQSVSRQQYGPQLTRVERMQSEARNAAAQFHLQHVDLTQMKDGAVLNHCLDSTEIQFHCPSIIRISHNTVKLI